MVLPTCPMAEFALPRHSAVMERLRRRIELCRRHHSTCEARYEAVSPERLELERQHTFALHQRCIQAKAKRAGKHRPPPAAPAPPPAAPARLDAADGPDLGRPGAHLHDPVKRNLDPTTSPQNGDQQNGYGDLFAAAAVAAAAAAAAASATTSAGHKKTRREAPPPSPRGAPLDKATGEAPGKPAPLGLGTLTKKGGAEAGPHLNGAAAAGAGADPFPLHRDLKQEPVDDLPCMLAGTGGGAGGGVGGGAGTGGSVLQSNLMPDLNLNEQEWKELIEELNRSVPDEDMKDLFADDFDDKKEPEAPAPPPPDVHVKSEFEPERRGRGSPGFLGPDSAASQPLFHAAGPPPGTELPTPGLLPPAAASSAQRAMPGVGLPGPSQGTASELSSAHQLQQMAAKQKRDQQQQLLQNPPPVAPAPGPLVGSWPATAAHGAFGGAYPLDKAASPPSYSKADFGSSALLLGPGGNQGSPRPTNAGGPYLQAGHHHAGLLGHTPSAGTPSSGPTPGSVLDYGNTKPLSHYKADCGQGSSGGGGGQGKAALMASYLQQTLPPLSTEQNTLFLLKAKAGTGPFRTLGPASQEQTPPNVPVAAQAGSVGGSQVQAAAGGAHSSAPYLSGPQQAAVLKQHQMLLDQQKQREQQHHFLQRQQQLLAEQEKQQFQRHLTRPPPQYQDPSQSTFPQQVGAFPGSSTAVPGMTSCPRVFSQPGNLMSLGPGLTPSISSLPAGSGPQERGVPQFSTGPPNLSQQPQPGSLYSMNPTLAPPPAANGHAHMPRPGGGAGAGAYGQNSLGGAGLSQPPHAKGNLAKAPAPRVSAALGGQTPAWQHQGLPPSLNTQTPGSAGSGTPFTATAPAFHLPQQQAHLKVSGPPFSQALPSRPLAPPGSAPQQRTSAPAPGATQPGLPGLSPAGPELGGFSQSPGPTMGGRGGLACTQAYPVRTAGAATELPCPFSGDSDLIDSLLKSRSSEEWIRDLDDLLGPQ